MENRKVIYLTAGITAAVTAFFLSRRQWGAGKSLARKTKEDPSFHPAESASKWVRVDESSWESFPASDPPSIP